MQRQDRLAGGRRRVRRTPAALTVAAVTFGAGYVVARPNPNAGLLLALGLISAGLLLVVVATAGLERISPAGGPPRAKVARGAIVALVLVFLATPWQVEISVAHTGGAFGFQALPAWLLAACLLVLLSGRAGAHEGWILGGGGASLLLWLVWIVHQQLSPDFSRLHYPFLPIDLLGEGWYAALVAWVLVMSARATRPVEVPAAAEVWWLAVTPGLGIARLGASARGRAWLLAAGLALFLLQMGAISSLEFGYYGATGHALPPAESRRYPLIMAMVLAVVWLASLWDTRRSLRQEAPSLRPLTTGAGTQRPGGGGRAA